MVVFVGQDDGLFACGPEGRFALACYCAVWGRSKDVIAIMAEEAVALIILRRRILFSWVSEAGTSICLVLKAYY